MLPFCKVCKSCVCHCQDYDKGCFYLEAELVPSWLFICSDDYGLELLYVPA
jgi:hypothetical protein